MKLTRILASLILALSLFFVSCGPKDNDIKASVENKIQKENNMTGITASVNDGVATLSGECDSEATKTKCTELAQSVKGVKSVTNNCTIKQMPVQVSPDDALRQGVMDATKDHPGVTAMVNGGVVTLTGNISRDKLAKLMQTVNALQPKQVLNQLTIK
jgi:osmotically-inducible protein OsmY